jgi:hypothetical protein
VRPAVDARYRAPEPEDRGREEEPGPLHLPWLAYRRGERRLCPRAFKLYTLSVIYKRLYEEILGFFGIHLADIGREQMLLTLPRAHLIGRQTIDLRPQIEIPANLKEQIKSEKTDLVSKMFGQWGGIPASLFSSGSGDKSVYGYVGMDCRTSDCSFNANRRVEHTSAKSP